MQANALPHPELPTAADACEQIPGRPLTRFELARHDLPNAAAAVDLLYGSSRARWESLETEKGSQVLWKEVEPDRFRYVIWVGSRRSSQAIHVVREPPGAMWSHGHVRRGRTLNCAIHRYVVSLDGRLGRLREQVEVRTTSSLLTFYRRPLERNAMRSADARLDDLVRELREPPA